MFLSKKQKRPRMTREEANAIIERAKTEDPLELEKGDKFAIYLAALRIFVPFVAALAGSVFVLWWLVFHVWWG